ncbi:hypothetical protein B0H11DRAFT_1901068 [Mycena galericulata]|nr:hypothetical protein B0H11DRAFT_1901068 [Mycena galericulata]
MSTTAALETTGRDIPSQFQVPPSNLSGPVGADTSTPSLDDPARPEPPTTISGGTSTSRTTGSVNPDSIPVETPSRGAVLRKRTRAQPDDPAHADPLNSMSGSPSTFGITGRTDPVTTTSDSPSTSRTTGLSRDPAPAATPPLGTLLRMSTRETQIGEGHTRDDLVYGSDDESGIRLDDLGLSNPFTTTSPGRRDPAAAATSSPGAVLQRSLGDSTLMDMGHRLDDQANELREISRRIAELEAKIVGGRSERPEVKITPWRALRTVFLLVVGAYKATATYLGQVTGPTTADWIIGVVWALLAVRAVCALRMPSRSTAAQLNGNKHSLWMNTLFGNLVSASGTTPTGDERHHTQNTRYLHGFDDERRRPLYLRSASIIAFYRYNIKWTHQLLFGTFGASLAGQRRATTTNLSIAPPKLFQRPAAHRPWASLAPQRSGSSDPTDVPHHLCIDKRPPPRNLTTNPLEAGQVYFLSTTPSSRRSVAVLITALSEADEELGHPSWFFSYDLSGVLYQTYPLLLFPFYLFGALVVSFKVRDIDKLDPETPFWLSNFQLMLLMVAGAGYPSIFDLLPKLKLGKLLRQVRLAQFLFHGSDWSLYRDNRFNAVVFIGGAVQYEFPLAQRLCIIGWFCHLNDCGT